MGCHRVLWGVIVFPLLRIALVSLSLGFVLPLWFVFSLWFSFLLFSFFISPPPWIRCVLFAAVINIVALTCKEDVSAVYVSHVTRICIISFHFTPSFPHERTPDKFRLFRSCWRICWVTLRICLRFFYALPPVLCCYTLRRYAFVVLFVVLSLCSCWVYSLKTGVPPRGHWRFLDVWKFYLNISIIWYFMMQSAGALPDKADGKSMTRV